MGKIHVFLDNISKSFGEVQAVKNLTLNVQEGEFITLLGPSGCGKTTTLRMLAGFYNPDKGEIYFHDKSQRGIPPDKRRTSIVFQEYALFPHMNVFDNISYGLRIRHIKKEEVQKKTNEILELVGLKGLEKRFPYELSGGQQQRVAMARSLIMEPEVLLMDEPLSNLDAKLRIAIREEIKQLQSRLKITTVYVTHDQEEALVLSDKIAVLNQGMLKQVDSPWDLYYKPVDPWVANFVGAANVIEGRVQEISDKGFFVTIGNHNLFLSKRIMQRDKLNIKKGRRVVFMIRPERLLIRRVKAFAIQREINFIPGTVLSQAFVGSCVRYWIRIDGLKDNIIVDDYTLPTKGILSGQIFLIFKSSEIYIFPK